MHPSTDLKEHHMSTDRTTPSPMRVPPPSKHQLALMIWLAVLPTLTVLNLTIGNSLKGQPIVVRTFIVATIAVPIVIYGLMPHLHRVRARLVVGRAS
jgi:antibiotic biosynthesis monooxygenase (ABM) superfamily enzyme